MDAMSEIVRALSSLRDPRILDVGCGTGLLARALSPRSAAVTGIDPNPGSIATARRSVQQATFAVATAESLPFEAGAFDGIVFLNSLHHVPDPRRGLLEAKRVSRSGSTIVVVEPLARGTFFEVLRCVEDETEVRAAAQRALGDVVSEGILGTAQGYVFERIDRFADVDAFLTRVVAVDPIRAVAVAARRSQVADKFGQTAERDHTAGYLLRQPLRVDILVRP